MNLMPFFWGKKPFSLLSVQEWEALCDGCGRCCLEKIEDEGTGIVYYTHVACDWMDIDSCRCTAYENRSRRRKDCLILTSETIKDYPWLPTTCAYRLLYEGNPLPDWHPLIAQNDETVHTAGISVRYKCISSRHADLDNLEAYIIDHPFY